MAVAILAAAANIIVSKSALLVRTGTMSNAVPILVARSADEDPPHAAARFDQTAADAFLTAIDRFAWISRSRAENKSKESAAEYLAATDDLRTTLYSFDRESARSNLGAILPYPGCSMLHKRKRGAGAPG